MISLTDKVVQSIESPAKGRRIITDQHRDAPRGFALRVNSNGSKLFVLRYKANGKDRLLTIGEYGPNDWSLAAARKQAGVFRRRIDAGEDILARRRTERSDPVVADVVERFCKAHADKLASGPDVRATFRNHLVPKLGKIKLKDVRRRDVIALVEALAETHSRQAALLLTYTKQLFAWAEDRELIEGNPVATLRPHKIAKSLAPRNRARILDDAEIRGFWENVETCGMHRLTALALKLILLTGQRPGEVVGMRWDEIEGSVWTIPAERRGKTATAHTVPLTETVREILETARYELVRLSKRRKGQGGDFVFETRAGRLPNSTVVAQAAKRFSAPLGNKADPTWGRWRPHDLRRTMRTGLSAAGVNETVAELVIGHTRKGIAAVYDLHKFDAEKRAALEAWERRLLRIVEGQPADDEKVVPMGRERAGA